MSMPYSVSLLVWLWDEVGLFLWWYHYPSASQTSDSFSSGSAVAYPGGIWGTRRSFSVFLLYHRLWEAPSYPCHRGCVCMRCFPISGRLMLLVTWCQAHGGVIKRISFPWPSLVLARLCVCGFGDTLFFPHGRQNADLHCALLSLWCGYVAIEA